MTNKYQCRKCYDTGEIEYYFDAGDHFGMGTAPGSGWRKKSCSCLVKKEQTDKNITQRIINYANSLDW